MINSIPQIESDKIKKFGNITTRQPSQYWLMPSKSDSVEIKPQCQINSKIIISPDEARKTKNLAIIGTSIAAATVLTAAGLFLFLKGGPKNLSKYFSKMKAALERKVQTSKLNNEGDLTFKSKAYIYLIKFLDTSLKKFEAVNNFTTFKDLLFKKIMFTTSTGEKIHDGITKGFEKIGRRAVTSSYRKTSSKIRQLKDIIPPGYTGKTVSEFVYINGHRISKQEALKLAENLNQELLGKYLQNFSSAALDDRYVGFKKVLEGLKITFAKLRIFWSKGLYSEFMAETALLKEKTALKNLVRTHRKELSYSFRDMASEVEDKIIKMTDLIPYKDVEKIKHLRDISSAIKKYAKDPVANFKMKDKILADIDAFSESVKGYTGFNNDAQAGEKLLSEITEIRRNLLEFKQGTIEDILDIYRQILPEKEFKKVDSIYKEAVKSLDKAVKVETEDYTSKLRDLALGSAPTDILTILGSLGVLGYQLGKSDDNDQRMSISLKYGIPALAGIGTALYCNAKLYAGSKSLIFGTISTLVVNKLGVWADDLRKKFSGQSAQKTK